MRIMLNGDPFALENPTTIAGLLAQLDIDPRSVAVERNFLIVKRDQYATTAIADGDQIEIVKFVGGGSLKIAELKIGELEMWESGNLVINSPMTRFSIPQ
jgi:thiamine biosynthesis protein ThiS